MSAWQHYRAVLASVSDDYLSAAVAELRDALGRGVSVERLAADLVSVIGPHVTAADVARTVTERPLIFTRHVTNCVVRCEPTDLADIAAAAVAVVRPGPGNDADAIAVPGSVDTLAVQAWACGDPPAGSGPADAAAAIARALRERGMSVVRAGTEHVLSCCITPDATFLALNRSADSLVDWPGGRVRLARGPTQISRAEFKLEELIMVQPHTLPTHGRALDLGAAPGGWTRLIRERGLEVWAVDPGALDPRLGGDRHVHHVVTTAGEFLRGTHMTFDLVVNDMRMEPAMSAQVMVDAADRLRRGATAVITLKLGTTRALDTVSACLRLLRRRYDVVFGRQLHHNRHEATIVLTRR
jgi:23S rRNA (cytidine2498-2'-O)-methyltransferase